MLLARSPADGCPELCHERFGISPMDLQRQLQDAAQQHLGLPALMKRLQLADSAATRNAFKQLGRGAAVAEAALVRYVVLEVVDFTRDRSVEAQSEIITVLSQLVHQAMTHLLSERQQVLYLPTGDGLCVCLINLLHPFDLDIQIALAVLQQLHQRNQQISDPSRRFALRVGINENQDNLITDIRGGVNVVGLGINMAQRVMSVAGPSRLYLGPAVYQRLQQRELYGHWLRPVQAIIKHGERLRCYEYFNPTLACFAQLEPLKASRSGANPPAAAPPSLIELPLEQGPRGRRVARRSAPPPSFRIGE